MSRARTDRWIFATVAAIVAALCIAGLYRALSAVFLHVPLDPDEGWNAYHAIAAVTGHGLYPRGNSFFFNNYPPLSFYVVGVAGAFVGDDIFAGRAISLVSFALVAVAIALLVRRANGRPSAAFFAALYFAATLLLFSDYVGMDDPQLLGHVFQLAGLFLILSPARTIADVAFAALLFVAGVFDKHNLFILPVAAVFWLVTENRRSAFHLAFLGFVFAYSYLVTADVMLGTRIMLDVLSPRIWSMTNLFHNLRLALPWLLLPLAALAWLAVTQWQDRFVRLSVFYASVALIVALVFAGGDGVDANIWFDAVIALSLAAGLFVERAGSRNLLGPAVAALMMPLLVTLWFSLDADWYTRNFWTHPFEDETATAESDIAFLRAHPGNAACETMSLCYWARKPEAIDFFNLGEAYKAHARDDKLLIDALAKKKFSVVEVESFSPFALTDGVLAALNANYRIAVTSDDGAFFVPR
jgi:hypothetical protein